MIKRNIKVPTGNICIIEGEEGLLEVLSIGDYGRAKNVKADFLGLHDDIEGVPNGEIMPLEHKWVVTMSTQYGCSMNCKFCDVPKVGKGRNATYQDLLWQLMYALSLHPEVKTTERLNIHFARMG
jgi:23S rRNA (adenine2503-C2)-methyltransferase